MVGLNTPVRVAPLRRLLTPWLLGAAVLVAGCAGPAGQRDLGSGAL